MYRILVSHPQYRMRSEREPTRVSYKIVTRLSYGKKKVNEIIHAEICPEIIKAEGYVVRTPCNRYHFVEIYRSSKVMFFLKKCFIRHSLRLCIFRTKNPKYNNLPLFCLIAKVNIFRKLRQLQMKTYHFLSRILLFSGDVESNSGHTNKYSKSAPLYHPQILFLY